LLCSPKAKIQLAEHMPGQITNFDDATLPDFVVFVIRT
jgi:hypothetical protein